MDKDSIISALYILGDSILSADGDAQRVCTAAAKKIDKQASEIVVLKTMVDVAQQELLSNQNESLGL